MHSNVQKTNIVASPSSMAVAKKVPDGFFVTVETSVAATVDVAVQFHAVQKKNGSMYAFSGSVL
jgi:hypothetical protein